jgi:hypothetical protein
MINLVPKKSGRKVGCFISCDKCGKKSFCFWVWDLSVLLPGQELRTYTGQNEYTLWKQGADQGFFKTTGSWLEGRHVCEACKAAGPPQLRLSGVA